MSNQHKKKNMTLTDFDKTWFLHNLSWGGGGWRFEPPRFQIWTYDLWICEFIHLHKIKCIDALH